MGRPCSRCCRFTHLGLGAGQTSDLHAQSLTVVMRHAVPTSGVKWVGDLAAKDGQSGFSRPCVVAARRSRLLFPRTVMSSLHSCHWDWCRFTTVLHDDLVQHVMRVHVDMAEPVRRKDISLLRQVEEGSLEYPGGSSIEIPTSSQLNTSQTEQSTPNLLPSVASGSTQILPVSSSLQWAQTSDLESQGDLNFELQTQALYKSQNLDQL